jgi:murein DD-endopeptidase MepM/ murein hydrolase activator NlpD
MSRRFIMLSLSVVTAIAAAAFAYYSYRPNAGRVNKFYQWIRNPEAHPDWKLAAGSQCGAAPFLFPTDGFAGFLWGDPFGFRKTHQGIDVFAGTDVGIAPVIAAYPGYLTRQADWKSAVIVRVPDDPLQPGRQIWLYYTHMADQFGNSFISSEFPAGTYEKSIEAGTFLGYQGNYSGDPNNPVGVHLHFSIVEDDGTGEFKNELDIDNTLDPSPYLGLPLNGYENRDRVPLCEATVE